MSLVAASLLAWSQLPGRWRRVLALLLSALGLTFLIVAVNTEGLHESNTTAVFLMGTPYLTQQASALASLPYYVLTGICLLLGTLALAAGDDVAHALAKHWIATAIGLGIIVSMARFALEKAAAGAGITTVFGVTWLAPVVGAYFHYMLKEEPNRWGALLRSLGAYGLLSRVFVVGLYCAATTLHLGTHYDISSVSLVRSPWGHVFRFEPGGLEEIVYLVLVPQVLVWPTYTVLAGLLGAVVLQSLGGTPPPQARIDARLAASLGP